MSQTDFRQPPVPSFRVRIDGADVSNEITADLLSVTVHDDLELPSMFTLRLINWDMDRLAVTWADDARFGEGRKVEVQMGYVGALETMIAGEITALEPEFAVDEIAVLTVRGYDRRHRLLRGLRTRSFAKMKDSDIASQVLSELGISAEATDSGVTVEYVLQHNQSDMEFLRGRAARIGYEIAAAGEKVLFRPRRHTGSPQLTLNRADDLISFAPRLTTSGQVGKVVVRSWSPKEKAVITAEAVAGGESGTMGGKTSGPGADKAAFGQSAATSVSRPVFSKAEADKLARSRLDEVALAYISGDGVCVGRTGLRAGAVIAVEDVGKRFSGQYYVTSASHSYMPDQGYRTAFSVRRNAT